MEFLKKHYEKILLSAVLLGLAVAAAGLPIQVDNVSKFLEETVSGVVRTTPKEFKPVNLETNEAIVKRFQGESDFNLSGHHNIFNPVVWKRRPDGSLLKIQTGNEIGPGALKVHRIEELRLAIEFEKAESAGSALSNYRYYFVVTRDTDSNPRKTQIAMPNVPNTLFELVKVEGPPEDPTTMHLLLKDEKEPIAVVKNNPYSRTLGYAAELSYPRENQTWAKLFRVKDPLTLKNDSERYKIVAITPTEVTVAADSTQKRTTVKLSPGPQASN